MDRDKTRSQEVRIDDVYKLLLELKEEISYIKEHLNDRVMVLMSEETEDELADAGESNGFQDEGNGHSLDDAEDPIKAPSGPFKAG